MADDSTRRAGGTNPQKDAVSLTAEELAVLRFEEKWPAESGAKEAARRRLFPLSQPRYLQVLHRLVVDERAVSAHPQVCARVVRRMELARARREARGGPLR
jgi:hypothetical protein